METKLKKSSWHKRLYEIWWRKSAPSNLCNYFWGLVVAIITAPFLIAGRIAYQLLVDNPDDFVNNIFVRSAIYVFNTFCVLFLSMMLGIAIGLSFYYPWDALGIFGGIVLVIAIIIGGVSFFESETYEMTSDYVSAKKQKSLSTN